MSLERVANGTHSPHTIYQILQEYDFIALMERMDESLVALQMILGLETTDILYLPAKASGGYDDGRYHKRCVHIQKSFVSPGMKKFFESDAWKEKVYWDEVLHQTVNRSLDRTIDFLGRDEFDKKLELFLHIQGKVSDECTTTVKFPCLANGTKVPDDQVDCLYDDMGCGFECIDRVWDNFVTSEAVL